MMVITRANRAPWPWLYPLLIVSVFLSTPLARADDPRVLARGKLVEGSDKLKQGEYTQALTLFKEAYDLVPSPKIFYDFGLAYSNLGRTTEAVEAFEKFLDEATDANPETRANAERHRSELLPQIGSVVVECDVEGAEISIDGRPKGVTPRKNPVRVDPGPHSLVVEKSPAPPFSQRLVVGAGQRVTVDVHLNSPPPPSTPLPTVMAPPPSPPPPAPSPVPESRPLALKTKLAIGLGAAGVLGLAFGTYEQLSASSKYDQFNNAAAPAPNPTGKCDADSRVIPSRGGTQCASLLSDGDAASLRAKIGFAVGGALAASSLVLYVLGRREQHESVSFIGCTPSGSGAICGAHF
jgi:hypothetical protein